MATTAEVLTLITANNNQFKEKIKESKKEVDKFANHTKSVFKEIKKYALGYLGFTEMIKTIKETYRSLDELLATAKKLDVGVEGFQALSYAAKMTNTEVSVLELGIKKLRNVLATPTQDSANAFKKLGLNPGDLKNISIDEAYIKISNKLKKITDTTDQVSIVNALLGARGGQEQLNLLRDDIEGFIRQAKELGLIIDENTIKKFEKLDQATKILATTIKVELQRAFLDMAPVLSGTATGLTKLVVAASKFTGQMKRGIGEGGNVISEGIGEGFTALRNMVKGDYNPNYIDPSLTVYSSKKRSQIMMSSNTASESIAKSGLDKGFIDVPKELNKLAVASSAAASALKKFEKENIKAIYGIKKDDAQSYLNEILEAKPQAVDKYFTGAAEKIRNVLQEGKSLDSVQFQSNLAFMKTIAQEYNKDPNFSNSGMLAVIKETEKAYSALKNINKQNEVIVNIKADKNGMIEAFATSPSGKNIMVGWIRDATAREAQITAATL